MTSRDYQIFELGDVVVQSGLTLRSAQLTYKTYGRLDSARSNVIVYPTSYGEVLPLDPPIQSPPASYHISSRMRSQCQAY